MKLKFSRFAVFTILFIGGLSPLVAQPYFWQLEGSANPFDQVSRYFAVDSLSLADLDGDGDLDLVIADAYRSVSPVHSYAYYENTGTRTNAVYTKREGSANPFDQVSRYFAVDSLSLADLDGDDDLDLVIADAYRSVTPRHSYKFYQDNRNSPPHFITGYPRGSNATLDGFDVVAQLNRPGKVYFVVVNNNDPVPSVNDVVNGTAANGVDALASAMININSASTSYTAHVSGLVEATDYDVYTVAEDDETPSHLQTSLTKVDFFTASPPSDMSLTPQVLAENLAIATTIGSFSATDKGTNTHTYTLVAGEGDTDNNAFSISGNSLQSALVFNYEEKNNYSIRVRVTDHTNLWFEKIFQIDVTDVDEIPPVFESGFPLVDNIGESEAELKIQMNELGTVYFVIVESGADAPTAQQVRNGLNASNGFAALKGSFKVEYAAPTITAFTIQLAEASNYDAYIVAHDDVSQANLQTIATKFSFSIKDRPTQLSLSPATMMEGNIAGDIVGRLSAVDEDSIALTYVLIDGEGADDNEQFMIVGDLLRTNISFDYELVTQYNIRVQVRDNDGLSSEQAFVINVSDIDDTAPIFENNYPSARVLTENSFELALKANETSEAFVLLYKAGEIEPSKAQIMMKDPYLDDGLTVFYHEVHQLSANTEATIPITGLLASTHYQVVIIAQDDELKPNIQTDISKLSITTADRQLSKDSKLFAVDGVSILMFVMMILLVMKRKISLVKIRL